MMTQHFSRWLLAFVLFITCSSVFAAEHADILVSGAQVSAPVKLHTKAVTEGKTPVYAQIAGHEIPVLTLNKGQDIDINAVDNSGYHISFGNASATIRQADLNVIKKDKIDS
ncbi:MAG: hypothetical protein ACRC4H_12730, partial [Plesiomonas sp.]